MKFMLVALLLAIAIYLAVRFLDGRGGGGRTAKRKPSTPPYRPMGPDDDPDFLRDLNRKTKRRDDNP